MTMREQSLRIYQTADGKVPFTEWLEGLRDRKARATIRTRLNRVRLGLLGDCKSVGEGVMEFRIHLSPGYRVYFAQEKETVVLLLCGGDKGSQNRDIARAKKYWQDYRRRDDA